MEKSREGKMNKDCEIYGFAIAGPESSGRVGSWDRFCMNNDKWLY